MAFALVQRNYNDDASGTCDVVISGVGASGRIIRVAAFWAANSALTSLTTRKLGAGTSDVVTPVGSRQWWAGPGLSFQEFVFLAPTSGVDDIRAVLASTQIWMAVNEYSGFTGTPEVTGTPVYTLTTTNNSSVTGTLTTGDTNAILLASVLPLVGSTAATDAGDGWVTDGTSGGIGGTDNTDTHWGSGCIGHAFLSSTGSKGPVTFTTTSGTSGDQNVIYAIGDNTGGASSAPTLIVNQGNRW